MNYELPRNVFKNKKITKNKIKQILFEILDLEDCYIILLVIVQKVKLELVSS